MQGKQFAMSFKCVSAKSIDCIFFAPLQAAMRGQASCSTTAGDKMIIITITITPITVMIMIIIINVYYLKNYMQKKLFKRIYIQILRKIQVIKLVTR